MSLSMSLQPYVGVLNDGYESSLILQKGADVRVDGGSDRFTGIQKAISSTTGSVWVRV